MNSKGFERYLLKEKSCSLNSCNFGHLFGVLIFFLDIYRLFLDSVMSAKCVGLVLNSPLSSLVDALLSVVNYSIA